MRHCLAGWTGLIVASMVPVFAAHITVTGSVTASLNGEGSVSETSLVQGFGALGIFGTLTQVTVHLDSTADEFFEGEALSDDAFGSAFTTGLVKLAGIDVASLDVTCDVFPEPGESFVECTNSDSRSDDWVFTTSLADFENTTVPLMLKLDLTTSLDGILPGSAQASADVRALMTYEYTPFVRLAPEPGTAWMFLGGLAAAGLALAKRKFR